MPKTKVIGFRVPNKNLLEWESFCLNQNLDLTSFIKKSVETFLQHQFNRERAPEELNYSITNLTKKRWLKSDNINLEETTYINIRLKVEDLQQWDEFCIRNVLDRTNLILIATHVYIHPKDYSPLRDFDRMKWIVYRVIREFGFMSLNRITTIFDNIEPNQLIKMLNFLETEYSIMRKGHEIYVPTGLDSDERNPNIRLLVENFEVLLETAKNALDPVDDASEGDEIFELLENESLFMVMFEYLETYLKWLMKQGKQREKGTMKKPEHSIIRAELLLRVESVKKSVFKAINKFKN